MKGLVVIDRGSMRLAPANPLGITVSYVGLIAVILISFTYGSAFGQSGDSQEPARPAPAESGQGQSYAPIGDSGYKVPIPVIRMKNIVGEKPASKKETGPVAPKPQEGSPEGRQSTPEHVQKLPFSPETTPTDAKTPLEPPSTEVKPAREVAPTVTPPAPTDRAHKDSVRSTNGGPVQRGPVEAPRPAETTRPVEPPRPVQIPAAREDAGPREKPSPAEVRPSKEQPIRGPGPAKVAPAKEEETTLRAPMAPREAIEPVPAPKKEILRRATEPGLPTLLEGRQSKRSDKALKLDSTEADDLADPRGWIQLEPRKEPESIPIPEPEPVREPAPESRPALEEQPALQSPPETRSLPEPQPPMRPVPEAQPAPLQEAPAEEPVLMKPPPPEPKEQPEAVDQVPQKEEALPAAKEAIPSPLVDDVLESREVRDYLRQTAPILEEISLLMARAPALTIEDYDPSDPNTAAIPKEVGVKMDAIKRDLQILDSKTFAIIPPTRYAQFHSLIRESITQTHHACDAIMSFLTDNKPENLQKAKEHVLKARDLIQKTRERGEQT